MRVLHWACPVMGWGARRCFAAPRVLFSYSRGPSAVSRSCRTFCGVKIHFSSPEEKERYIKERIEESRRRFQNKKTYECPACTAQCGKAEKILEHMMRCCADLLVNEEIELVDDTNIDEVLQRAKCAEDKLMQRAIFVEFKEPMMLGMKSKRSSKEVAKILGLPIDRALLLMRRALKRVPLVADSDPVDVVYEDGDLIVLNKVPFVITAPKHRYAGGTMVNKVIGHLGREPFVVHRLDMNTTGVLMMAKSSRIAAAMHKQFRNYSIGKWYLAIVSGILQDPFVVDAPIGRTPNQSVARMISPSGQAAQTEFHVLDINQDENLGEEETNSGWYAEASEASVPTKGAALLLCRPKTGRTHQIRVHLAHVGNPIIGDEIYGLQGPWINRQALHAWVVSMHHPSSQKPLELKAPLPEDFSMALAALSLKMPKEVNLTDLNETQF